MKGTNNRLKIIFLFTAIALVVLSIMSYVRIQNLIHESKLVNHTQTVKLELNKTFSIIVEIESSQRAFLLSNDSVFLSAIYKGRANLGSHIDSIAFLTKDNPSQQQNIHEMRTVVFKRLDFLQKILEDAQTTVIDKQRWLIGKSLMDDVVAQITKMENEENNLLQKRTASLNETTVFTPLLMIVLMIGSITILIASYIRIMQELGTSDTLKSKIEKSEERYHRMIAEVKDYAILFLNKEGIIENWNEGARKIKGYEAEEIIGKHFSIFYREEDRQDHLPEKLLAEAKQSDAASHEGWRVRKDGSLFWGSILITAIHDKNNNLIGFSKVTRDLTIKKAGENRIKEMNEELLLKNKELEKSNKELESFTYISSHDLQEPLRQIQNFVSRILDIEQQNLSDKGKNYFEKMNNAAKRMQTLITDLLAYSRIKTGERTFEIINLKQIVNEVTENFAEAIAEKHATIEIEDPIGINVIHFQFRQMIHNLIGNALKFSKSDKPPHIVIKNRIVKSSELSDVTLAADTGYYHISITDNGIGFEPQYKDRIFEVFQRLHDRGKFSGTGIGLAIVKKIVENHNGIITTTSQLNEGATFDIYIPEVQTH